MKAFCVFFKSEDQIVRETQDTGLDEAQHVAGPIFAARKIQQSGDELRSAAVHYGTRLVHEHRDPKAGKNSFYHPGAAVSVRCQHRDIRVPVPFRADKFKDAYGYALGLGVGVGALYDLQDRLLPLFAGNLLRRCAQHAYRTAGSSEFLASAAHEGYLKPRAVSVESAQELYLAFCERVESAVIDLNVFKEAAFRQLFRSIYKYVLRVFQLPRHGLVVALSYELKVRKLSAQKTGLFFGRLAQSLRINAVLLHLDQKVACQIQKARIRTHSGERGQFGLNAVYDAAQDHLPAYGVYSHLAAAAGLRQYVFAKLAAGDDVEPQETSGIHSVQRFLLH